MRPQTKRQEEGAAEPQKLRADSGQIVLEYILLLVISVSIATYMTKKLVGRNPDEPGFITSKWSQISTAIGEDLID